ncbi:MAG: CoA transferase [Acidobacteria bacterium]|nr:CoA transferase [Acidobacteriota bacterium]
MTNRAKPPLEGVTVVSIEQAVAAPFATRQLADLGARVIKIERPDGGDFARAYDTTTKGLSSHFVWLNRSKQSLTLDLKQPAGIDVLHRLLDRADVFVQNLAPGAAERLGAGSAALRTRCPKLVICNISGFGNSGPYASKKAYDLLVQGEAGLMSLIGPEDTPSRAGLSLADISAGMYAYSGILTALLARRDTGSGTVLDVSLFDSLAEWMGFPMYHTLYSGRSLPRSGPNHASIAPYGPFAASDGRCVILAVQNAREWTRFCAQVLERADLAADPKFASNEQRVRHRPALHDLINDVFAHLSLEEVTVRLEAADIAHARLNSVPEFLEHPQLSARGRWTEIDSEAGSLRALRPPVEMENVDPVMGRVPALGEHTDAILEELDIDRDTIAGWRRSGTI